MDWPADSNLSHALQAGAQQKLLASEESARGGARDPLFSYLQNPHVWTPRELPEGVDLDLQLQLAGLWSRVPCPRAVHCWHQSNAPPSCPALLQDASRSQRPATWPAWRP